MKIERLEVPGLSQYSYVISCGGQAAVIDAMRDIDRYTDYAAKHDLKITYVLETHIHADFAAGSTALADATGAELALSGYDKEEHYRYAMPHRTLRDGDAIEFGGVRIQALHTPGHTPEHLSFLLFDSRRSPSTPLALFSGDFLFVGSLGRPDLLGDEAKLGLAHELFRSLHDRIASLPDGITIYPGHGAGSLCGAGMSDRAESTLGYERATNQFFQLSQNRFVEEILGTVPPMPHYYPRMKEWNARGARSLPCLPGHRGLSPSQVAEFAHQGDTVLLDLRRPEAFGGTHIPNSINIGAGQSLSLWAGWLIDPAKRIVLIGECGDDESSRRSLIRVGLDRIEGFLAKGIASWIDSGLEIAHTLQVSPEEAARNVAESLILDVRSNQEWKGGHIPGAMHVMLGNLADNLDSIPFNRPIIAVCGSGYRSSIAASLLTPKSRHNVSSMAGGMTAWLHHDLPVAFDDSNSSHR